MKMTSKLSRTLLLVLAITGFTSFSATAQKQTPPPGAPPKAFHVPATESDTLPNGMRVTLIPYGNIPKTTVNLAIATGNLNEPKNKSSIADITGNLMKEGTATLSAQQLAEAAARMGTTLGIGVGVDQSTVDMDVLEEFGT